MTETLYPYGSTAGLRQDVLRVLGVLKVATAEQIRALTRPAAKSNKSHRNAALDLQLHGLTVSEGHASNGHKLWGLTPAGLASAASLLRRGAEEMGGTAPGTARHGAVHALAVNETITTFIQSGAGERRKMELGEIAEWSTEVPLPASGSWSRPGVGSPRADAVLYAPEAEVPLLLVEVDCGTETAATVAAKFERYQRFFQREVEDTDGRRALLWRTRWGGMEGAEHPPVAVVFTGLGSRGLRQRMEAVGELSVRYWLPSASGLDGLAVRRNKVIPILVTTLDRLRVYGPHGPTWWRYGHRAWESLGVALGQHQISARVAEGGCTGVPSDDSGPAPGDYDQRL
ncbi:replication-relaxation family protein [Streptomyces sp. NPDC014734]|uniref:replication-relaxation family protein n=1 Tax=Streptomyces sp. NPDC014734 TaxID=3364886 RepID=UPI0036FC2FF1